MYTGFYSPAPPPRRNGFWIVLMCCLIFISGLLGIAARIFSITDKSLLRNTVLEARNVSPPELLIVSIPAPSPKILVDDSGREVLSAKDLYRKMVPSVVGVVSETRSGITLSSGTGTVISADGYVCTNAHVVSNAEIVYVVFDNGDEYPATIVGTDYLSDVAVLKIKAEGLTPVEFGDSDKLEPGDSAFAIGNPLGLELQNTITNGIISAINRDIEIESNRGEVTMTVLQTNCALNPGNSGGPLCNEYGQMVGIISSKIIGDIYSSVEGLGFAIPINTAIPIINELIEVGYVRGRPAIGITANTAIAIDEQTAAYYGVPIGVVVDSVNPKSDAYKKGVSKGDIISHVNGEPVTTVGEINSIKNRFKAGDSLSLTIYRSGQTFDIIIVLSDEADLQ